MRVMSGPYRLELESNALPRYKGLFCQHSYLAKASLDFFDNDPDSGWSELN